MAVTTSQGRHMAVSELCRDLSVDNHPQDDRKFNERFDRSCSIDMLSDNHVSPPGQVINATWNGLVLDGWNRVTRDHGSTIMSWYAILPSARDDRGEKFDEHRWNMWHNDILIFIGVFRPAISRIWQIVFSSGAWVQFENARPIRTCP